MSRVFGLVQLVWDLLERNLFTIGLLYTQALRTGFTAIIVGLVVAAFLKIMWKSGWEKVQTWDP